MSVQSKPSEYLPDPPQPPAAEAPITERWKWTTVIGNAVIGAAELVTGNFSTMSVASDGLHNVGDTATYYMQAQNILDPSRSEQRRLRMRKAAHWIIAASSLGISAKAGVDLALDHEGTPHDATLYAASASLLLNGFMLGRLRRGLRGKQAGRTVYEQDLAKHFWAVDIPSAALAVAGAFLQKFSMNIEQVAAVASGVVGAYAFRPTKANLSHHCLDHDFVGETGHGHGHGHGPRQPGWLQRRLAVFRAKRANERQPRPARWRRAIGLGATAVALAAGLFSGDTLSGQDRPEQPDASSAPAAAQPRPEVSDAQPQSTPSTTECLPVQTGDSQWSMVRQRLQQAAGTRPSAAAVNTVVAFTAIRNKDAIPRPDALRAGSCLFVPTVPAARMLHDAIERPQAHQAFAADLHVLNTQPNRQAVLAQDAAFGRIDSSMRSALKS